MKDNNLRQFIKYRGVTISQAAKEIGVSRPLLHHAMDGNPLGRESSLKVEKWSNGMLRATELAGFHKENHQ